MSNPKKLTWERQEEKGGGVATSFETSNNLNKQDFLDCIESVMRDGGITLSDILDNFSPSQRKR